LLESLARNAEQAIEAGGQVDHEHYRYAVSLAQRIVDAVDDYSPAP
jgi:hypothetical protein